MKGSRLGAGIEDIGRRSEWQRTAEDLCATQVLIGQMTRGVIIITTNHHYCHHYFRHHFHHLQHSYRAVTNFSSRRGIEKSSGGTKIVWCYSHRLMLSMGGVKGLGKYKNFSLGFALKQTYITLLIIFIFLKFKSSLESQFLLLASSDFL